MIELTLQPAQSRAYLSTATEILYGGAAGGGKSYLMRAAAIIWARMIPGLQIAIFRRLYPDLRANHMEGPASFPMMLAPLVNAGLCRIVKDEITFANGSRISLNHCQHEKDKYKYQGAEFHVLMMDELTHFTETQYRYLRGRVRMTGLELPEHLKSLFPRILCGANPGGLGHVWVKKTFVAQGSNIIVQQPEKEGGMKRQYIPAKLSDNMALLASDPNYSSRLSGLGDPLLVRAMLEGDWSIAAGAMFGEVWRDNVHICDPFAIPIDWPLWRGADDGYIAEACCLWFTQDPLTKTIYGVAELCATRMLPEVYAARIATIDKAIPRFIQHTGEIVPNTAQAPGFLDSASFSDDGSADTPRGKQINKHLAKLKAAQFKPVPKWDGSRIHGAQNLHRLLGRNPMDPRGGPGIRFFRNCRSTCETIPALPRDKDNPEDVDTDAFDHPYDAARYGLQYKLGGFRKEKGVL